MKSKLLFSIALLFFSCAKEEITTTSSIVQLPTNLIAKDDKKEWNSEDIMNALRLADKSLKDLQVKTVDSLITTEELKYGLEALINMDYHATKPIDDQHSNHTKIYTLDVQDGKVSTSVLEEIHLDCKSRIDNLISDGADFVILDLTLTTDDKLISSILTTTAHFEIEDNFGFNLFPDNNSYDVLSESFSQEVNNRLLWEALDPSEFFYTDLTPDPYTEPAGYGVFSSTIIGDLGLGDCLMYAGTKEIFGGPEIVFGMGQNDSYSMSGEEINERLLRGITFVQNLGPEDDSYIMIGLKFFILQNQYAADGVNCLPGDPCSDYYPCFGKSHKWTRGRFARKMAVSK